MIPTPSESSSARRPGFDVVGIVTSSAGLAVLTYGFIEAGQHGWGSAPAGLLAGSTLPVALQAPSECAPPSDDFWMKFGTADHRGQ